MGYQPGLSLQWDAVWQHSVHRKQCGLCKLSPWKFQPFHWILEGEVTRFPMHQPSHSESPTSHRLSEHSPKVYSEEVAGQNQVQLSDDSGLLRSHTKFLHWNNPDQEKRTRRPLLPYKRKHHSCNSQVKGVVKFDEHKVPLGLGSSSMVLTHHFKLGPWFLKAWFSWNEIKEEKMHKILRAVPPRVSLGGYLYSNLARAYREYNLGDLGWCWSSEGHSSFHPVWVLETPNQRITEPAASQGLWWRFEQVNSLT